MRLKMYRGVPKKSFVSGSPMTMVSPHTATALPKEGLDPEPGLSLCCNPQGETESFGRVNT